MRKLKYLVIHCTDTPEGRKTSAADIKAWHLTPPPVGRGWKQVGYTDMIHLDGSITRLVNNNEDEFVDNWEITNGVRGYNGISRHIVYVGGRTKDFSQPKDTRTPAQLKALEEYVKDFKERFPNVEIVGHRDLDSGKACPSFDVKMWIKSLGL